MFYQSAIDGKGETLDISVLDIVTYVVYTYFADARS